MFDPNGVAKKDFTLEGLETGTYKLQFFLLNELENHTLPDPNDFEYLVDETTLHIKSDQQSVPFKPDNGMWVTEHNPSPGSGITFLTYNDLTMVTIYTYDQDGNQQWFNGYGTIDENSTLDIMVHEARSGSPINAQSSNAGTITSSRYLNIVFYGNNLAKFSIDFSPQQNVYPLYFGITGWSLPTTSNHLSLAQMLPNLQGDWVYYAYDTDSESIINESVKHLNLSSITEVGTVIGTHTNNIPEAYWTTENGEQLTCLLDLSLDGDMDEIHDYGCVLTNGTNDAVIIPVSELTQDVMTGYKGSVIERPGMADDYQLTDNGSIVYKFKRLQ